MENYWVEDDKESPPPLDTQYENLYQSKTQFYETSCSIIQTGNYINNPNKKVVIKFVKNKENSKHNANIECKIMAELSHHHLLKFISTFAIPKFTCFVFEPATYGTLLDIMDNQRKQGAQTIPEILCKKVLFQLCHALNCLHQSKYIHRNIRPENILVYDWPHQNNANQNNANQKVNVTLAGFGHSIFLNTEKHTDEKVGTLDYMAPEILKQDYSYEVDIWSLGIILFRMLTGRAPFPNSKYFYSQCQKLVYNANLNFSVLQANNISPDAISLLRSMLIENPKERIHAGDILKSSWLRDIAFEDNDKYLENPMEFEKAEGGLAKDIDNAVSQGFDELIN